VLRVLPPPIGEKVVSFGYREGTIHIKKDANEIHHIELNDRPTTSIGTINQVYPYGRDRIMLPFPCFEIEARFEPGMSGGMVVDETGALCGLICASLQQSDSDAPPLSYVAALWPMLKTIISVDRGDNYPRGVSYRMIDLAIDGQIAVVDLHELDPREFPNLAVKKKHETAPWSMTGNEMGCRTGWGAYRFRHRARTVQRRGN
jgi:hypothetical protein